MPDELSRMFEVVCKGCGRLCQVGDLVGVRVLNHLVLGEGGSFRSLAADGLLGGAR